MDYNWILGFLIGIIAAYVVILIIYLNAEKKNDGKNGFALATSLKLTLSGLFCIAGIISFYYLVNTALFADKVPPHLFILLGVFFAFAGDYFLQYIRLNTGKYIAGILCFTATQVLFITTLVLTDNQYLAGWIASLVITVIVLLCVLAMMKKQNWQLGKEKSVLTVYTVLLTFMTSKAFVSLASNLTDGSILFAAGAVLFLLSDILLGLWNYKTSKRVHANLNWIAYYCGMILIALSIMPAF